MKFASLLFKTFNKQVKFTSARLGAALLGLCAATTLADSVVMFNEVMYHPAGNSEELEWVELFNAFSYDMDISEWELDGGIEFTFPDGTIIPADGYLVVAKSPSALQAASGISNVYGPFDGKLSNGGEEIRLENNSGRIMDELGYEDDGNWPIAPDGSDASLAKVVPVSASGQAKNWHSGAMGGTPGEANFSEDTSSTQHTLLARDSDWKYRDLGTDPGSSWMLPTHDDSGWSSGPAELGYNLNGADPVTIVSYGSDPNNKYPTTYFRHHFEVANASVADELILHHLIDDGAVFYLNGIEVGRYRINAGPVIYSDYSDDSIPDAFWASLSVPSSLLVVGQNTLAAEIHQTHASSSDLSFNIEMVATAVVQTTNSNAQLLEDPELTLNEIQGITNATWWVELKNDSDGPLEIGGYILSAGGDSAREFALASQTVPAGGYIVVSQAQLGFTMQDEEPLFLYRPGKVSVADAQNVEFSLRGKNGDEWERPVSASPGSVNVFSVNQDVVINEIMYHHQPDMGSGYYAESDEEWIELYNRGTAPVDLSGWEVTGDVDFEFPTGTTLAAGQYLLLVEDAAVFSSNYPAIPIAGVYGGKLSNSDGRLTINDQHGNKVDEVHFFDGGRWPEFADGGGASLELRDPLADNSVAEAWAASNEEPRSSWQTYTYETVAAASAVGPDWQWKDFVLGLLDSGEVLLDDISVIEDPYGTATELISTSDFEGGVGDWRIIGNHRQSEVITDPDSPGNKVLKLVASGVQEHMHNHAEITLASGQAVDNGKTYRVSYRAKWIEGSRWFNTRLYFNRAAKSTLLEAPMNNGTPDAQNSTYSANVGPTFAGMRHEPIVPQANEAVTISIQADDAQGVYKMNAWYSVNGGSWQSSAMALNGDNLYRTTIPAQSASAVVQFYVEAEDALGAVSTFPARGANARALYKVDDGLGSTTLHNFRIIMTDADADFMDTDIQLMSNEQLGCTVIFDERDIYYNVGVRLKSSEHGRVNDIRIGFRLNFHSEQPFNGVHQSVAVDRSAGQVVGQREMLINMVMNRGGGVLSKYNDLIKVIAPKEEHTSAAELQLARFGDVYLGEQFGNDDGGTLFEYELIYHLITADENGYKLPGTDGGVSGSSIKGLGDDKENYRYNFMIKNNRSADDYTPLIAFAKKMGLTGDSFNQQIGDVVDVDQYLRYMAYGVAHGHGDTYTTGIMHNGMFYFRPSDGRALFFPHDMDFIFNSSLAIVPNADLQKMIGTPERERLYYGHMWDILQNVYNVGYMQFWTDQLGALLPTENFASYLTFIGSRHNYLVGQISAKVAPQYPFAVTVVPPMVGGLSTTVSGDGWLDVDEVYIDGYDTPLTLTWTASGSGTSRTYRWSAEVPLDPGENVLEFLVYNFQGELIDTESVSITSTATGDPLKDHLRITELMYDPVGGSDYEFIELYNSGTTTLDLAGVYFNQGISFSFTDQTLNPSEYIVLVGNLSSFASQYDTNGINIAGTFSGSLANGGEKIEILGPLNTHLLDFSYSDNRGWPLAADGAGHSLVARTSAIDDQSNGSMDYGNNWKASAFMNGSPGYADPELPASIVINEIVAHSDYSDPAHPLHDSNDQIELYNSTTNAIQLDHFYLSDDKDELQKWRIPSHHIIEAHGFITFTEVDGFHDPITEGFGMNKAGEQVFLAYVNDSGLALVVDSIRFKGQENSIGWGRYPDSTNEWHTLSATRNASNALPALRPVLTEIMYHPLDETTNNVIDEYIEIHNPADVDAHLWNANGTWRIDGDVTFSFPENTSLAVSEFALIVSFDPADSAQVAAFKSTYGITNSIQIFGPYSGALDNKGGRLALEHPQAPDFVTDNISWVIDDEVIYFHMAPWPVDSDGTGLSLQRKHTRWDGNNPENWFVGQSTTPGEPVPMFGNERVPEHWFADVNPGWTNNLMLIVNQDTDLDGSLNGEEYIAGTSPIDGASVPSLDIYTTSGSLAVGFDALKTTRTYNGLERYYDLMISADILSQPFANNYGGGRILGEDLYEELLIDTAPESSMLYRLNIELDE